LQKFIEGAKEGVIYFSMGSLVRSETFPEEKLRAFLDAFSELPQRILWKTDNIPGLPKNVMTSKWLPQFDILSMTNTLALSNHSNAYVMHD
jgi:glucuronosyltransferase